MTKVMNRISRKQERRERAIERICRKYGELGPDRYSKNEKPGNNEVVAAITLANTIANQQRDASKAGRRTKKDRSVRGKLHR